MKALVDNFDLIASMLPEKADKDTFWVIRVIGRKKDNPDLEKNSKCYKAYTVQSKSELMGLKGKIIACAVENRARAYFNPNARSWRKVALSTLKRIADYISCENYSAVQFAADRCLDEGAAPENKKKWIIDIDSPTQYNPTKNVLRIVKANIVAEIPTVNGMHIITEPFNHENFWNMWRSYDGIDSPEIKTNNPTLLYYNRIWEENMDL